MKNFSLKTRANYRHNSKKSLYIKITVGILVGLIALRFFSGLLGAIGSFISTPIYAIRSWATESSATVPLYFRSRTQLIGEIDLLKQQIAARSGGEATVARMSYENNALRSILSIYENDRIAARVMARPPLVPYDVLLLDRGSVDGIKENAVVYVGNDQAIGIISRVFKRSALVTLFSSPGIETTAYIIGPNIYTTSYGEGGGVVRVSVPQGIDIAVGNVVIIPSLESGVLGIVSEVESISTQPEQHGYIVRAISTQSLDIVSVSSRVLERISFDKAQEYVENHPYDVLKIDVPEEFIVDINSGTTTDGAVIEDEPGLNDTL